MPGKQLAVSLVEKGWAGARRLSIELAGQGMPVVHLVKGTLPRSTREVLTPRPGVSIVGVPPRLFRAAAWIRLRAGNVALVITDNAKSDDWVKRTFPRLREKVRRVGG